MAKIKLTKNELKKQKDSLKMYKRYLPTLQLKKQQLQSEIRGIEARQRKLAAARDELNERFKSWVGVFADVGTKEFLGAPSRSGGGKGPTFDDEGKCLVRVGEIRTGMGNIAGVEIPVYLGADFVFEEYDFLETPAWVDKALENLGDVVKYDLEIKVLDEQIRLLGEELRTTTQRVNLFEKVKIPESLENIRKIRIYLGDQQTAQVVRGKIAKRKVERVAE